MISNVAVKPLNANQSKWIFDNSEFDITRLHCNHIYKNSSHSHNFLQLFICESNGNSI